MNANAATKMDGDYFFPLPPAKVVEQDRSVP